jgi:hypothetical protein
MRRSPTVTRSTLAFLCCLSLAAACSDGGGDSTPPTQSPKQLEALLLNAADMGAGWIGTTAVSSSELGSLAESPCPGVTIDPEVTARLKPVVGVRITPSDGTNRAVIEGIITGDPATLSSDVEALFAAAQSCSGTDFTGAKQEKARYDTMLLPAVGDQQMATVLKIIQPPDYQLTARGHTAIVRVGDIVVSLTQYEVMKTPDAEPITSNSAFTALLNTAIQRVRG